MINSFHMPRRYPIMNKLKIIVGAKLSKFLWEKKKETNKQISIERISI